MLTPGTALPEVNVFRFQDKLIHFVIFFILAYLSSGIGIGPVKGTWRKNKLWMNFLWLALLPSILFETAQHLIPFRTFDLIDLIFNLLGVTLGLFGYLYRPTCKFILD